MYTPQASIKIPEKWHLLAEIPYTNPFTNERIQREKNILGSSFEPYRSGFSSPRADPQQNRNLQKMMQLAMHAVTAMRAHLERGPLEDARAYEVYEDLLFLVCYYEVAPKMDRYISKAHQKGNAGAKLLFYDEFLSTLRYYMDPARKHGWQPTHSNAHLFAVFFQIRRAYYHIFESFLGNSQVVMNFRADVWKSIFTHNIRRFAKSLCLRMRDNATLITGPSGSGKELVARSIGLSLYIPFNEQQLRFEEDFLKSFYPINLAAMSETLIESELFGHAKGAFTGALAERSGYFESAGSFGCVFLDEIGEVTSSVQVKLLRLLQTRMFQRMGETHPRFYQGKVIAATNRDLSTEIKEKRFREDLFFRICSDQLIAPPLHDMVKENPTEMEYLVGCVAKRMVGEESGHDLSCEVLDWMDKNLPENYPWSGNFRELEQCIRNIMVRGNYEVYGFHTLPSTRDPILELASHRLSVSELFGKYATQLYRETGSIAAVANILKVDRRTAKKAITF